MEARATKAPRVLARYSKSLARRRLRPHQEKVRSTRTTKLVGAFHDPTTLNARSGGGYVDGRVSQLRSMTNRYESVDFRRRDVQAR